MNLPAACPATDYGWRNPERLDRCWARTVRPGALADGECAAKAVTDFGLCAEHRAEMLGS